MLDIPNIFEILISINRFAGDNSCEFVFDASGFCVKDKATRKTLFGRQSENGLFSFSIRRISSPSNKAGPTGKRVSSH